MKKLSSGKIMLIIILSILTIPLKDLNWNIESIASLSSIKVEEHNSIALDMSDF